MIDRPAPLDLDTVLSPTWLSNVLDEPVAEVHVVEALTLNIASKIRICVEYADGVSNDRPRAFCVKGYFKPESASFASLGQQEVRFYRDLAPLTTIERPECVYGGIDETTGHGVIVMKDLIEAGCTFLTPLSPYSVDKAAATVVELAKLHHVDPSSSPGGIDWLSPKLGVTLDYIGEERLQELLGDGRADGLPSEVADAGRMRRAFAVVAERAASNPNALIHADCHAGNLYLMPTGTPGLIDWQVLQRGHWSIDVAYHLSSVLDVADRERNERSLLEHYLAARRSLGDEPPTEDEAWDLYRDAMIYGWYMWSITYRVAPELTQLLTRRIGAAVAYHETLDRLGA